MVSEAGQVDLNASDATLLASAYRAARLGALNPDVFAARVIAWREAAGGVPAVPSNTGGVIAVRSSKGGTTGSIQPRVPDAFRTRGDLRWVPGVSRQDAAALAPYVTVYNPSGKLDPLAAAPTLLAALPGTTADDVATLQGLPAVPSIADLLVLRAVFRGEETHLVLGEASRAFAVKVEGRLVDGGPIHSVRAILIAPVTTYQAFQVADWQNIL